MAAEEEQTIYRVSSGAKLFLCGHGKGRRDRQNIQDYANVHLLRGPGSAAACPGAEAVTGASDRAAGAACSGCQRPGSTVQTDSDTGTVDRDPSVKY